MKTKLMTSCLALLFFLISPLCGATIINIQPSAKTVAPGDTFSLNIGISAASDLYAWQFDVGYDPAVLSVLSVTEGSMLASRGATVFVPGTIDNFAGDVTSIADSLVGPIPGVNGSGTLAAVQFQALGSGSSPISLSNVMALNSTFGFINATSNDGSVDVQSVPEPPTLALLCAAMLCFTVVHKKMRRANG